MLASICIVLLFLTQSGTAQDQNSLPANTLQVAIEGRNAGTCPSAAVTKQALNSTKQRIRSILRDMVVLILDSRTLCGGPGWHRTAHLNMSDPNQQCPSNWLLFPTPVRTCGKASTTGCDAAVFPSNGTSYSHVCGRINAFQQGTTDAFYSSTANGANPSVESAYVDGVSLTHGTAGSRQHIWTFAAALYETDPGFDSRNACPCTNTDVNWPHQIPSFIGNNYFCDTGNPGPGLSFLEVYQDDPLWDGEGCGTHNTCCHLNNPLWFCTTLPQPTTDDIELRICSNEGANNENVLVQLVEIYVM